MKRIFLTLCILALPAHAFAYGCDCGSVSVIVTNAKTETIQTINAYTSVEAEAIRSEILIAAQNIIGTIKSESATIVRAIVSLKESNAAILKGQSIAEESIKAQDMYGKTAQPTGLCGASTLGAGVQLGAQAQQEVQATMREKQQEYGNNIDMMPLDYLNRILDSEHPQGLTIVDAFFPLQTTLTEDQVVQAHEAIKTLANPRPMPVITDDQLATPAGQTYASARAIYEGRMATIMEALNGHVVYHAPTLPEDVSAWAEEQWSDAGGSGTPVGLVEEQFSEAGLYKLISQMRVGNPNWFMQISSATEAGLLRELVLMQAFQLELMRKNTELLDQMNVITALDVLSRMEQGSGKELGDLYTRMIGAQQ